MNRKNIVALCFFMTWCFLSYSQTNKNEYSYSNFGKREQVIQQIEKVIKQKKDEVYSDKYKKDKVEIYDNMLVSLKGNFNDSVYVFNKILNDKLTSIFEKIVASNPQIIQQSHYTLIDKNIIPNASSYGNGLFTVNLGLFFLLESDAELAFVLSHEYAHQELKHSKAKIDSMMSAFNSEDLKNNTKRIKKMKYGKGTAARAFLKKMNFAFKKNSRKNELEADSLGFQFYKKTGFDVNASVSALEKLGKLEELVFKEEVNWKSLFNVNGYKFDFTLLEEEEMMFDLDAKTNDYEINKDSIRSHPHIKERVEKIKEKEITIASEETNNEYKELSRIAKKLCVKTSIDHAKLDIAFYLISSEIAKGNEEYYEDLGSLLKKLYFIKKNRLIGKEIPHPNDRWNEENLNSIRKFMHNISLYQLKKLSKAFLTYHIEEKNRKELESYYTFYKQL
ncbi:M48 family metallopeptidase [Aureivirga marina]|uniref:M48 family metallopeptidase n=1 Tax=Aureivirga marina TaxID=1182451 RepID=UPI0018CA59C7|nr:M48 family metallopeptidase [Aureivirga marina]